MLLELAIRDFAIIDELRISFEPGLNALTGETGAGKSIIIDALGAVLGERVTPEVVRTGAKSAVVEAQFVIGDLAHSPNVNSLLAEHGIEPEDGVLIFSREIAAGGRSGARINGRAVTATLLAQLGQLLVDIHGQSDHLSLLRPAVQLELLDRYAATADQRAVVAQLVGEWRGIRQQLSSLMEGQREREQRLDLLNFQASDIEEAALHPGEDAALTAERQLLANSERLGLDAVSAYDLLAGGEDDRLGVVPSLQLIAGRLNEIASIDPNASPLADRAREAGFLLEDLSAEVREYRDGIEANPSRLAEVEDRLELIRRLKRKYGASIEEVVAFGLAARAEIECLTGDEASPETLAARESQLREEIGVAAGILSSRRKAAADRLSQGIEQSIAELNMGRSAFSVLISHAPGDPGIDLPGHEGKIGFDETGFDRVEFLLAPNDGEALKPLARVASGGETARLMLALKSILAEADETPTLVFDEVDVGVGGRSGQVVGEKLWGLTRGHQVIVITHLAQIAAFADAHFRIEKTDRAGRVASSIDLVEGDIRLDEIAAMLDGLPPSEESRANARQLLDRVALWTTEHRDS